MILGTLPHDPETECRGGIGHSMADAETGDGYFESFAGGVEGEDVRVVQG